MPAVPKESKTKTASKQTGALDRLASFLGRSSNPTPRALQPKKVNKTSISSPLLQSSTSGQAQPTHLAPSFHTVAGANIRSQNNAPNASSPNPSSSNGTGIFRSSARAHGAYESTGGSLAKTAPTAPHLASSSKPPAHSTMMHASGSTPLSSSSFSRSSTVRRGNESKSASTTKLPVDTARARVPTTTSVTARLQRPPVDAKLYTPAATSSRAAHSVVKPTASSSRNGRAAKPAFSVQRTPASKPVPPAHEHRLSTHPYLRRRSREGSSQPASSSVTTAASSRKLQPSASATLRTSKTFSTADASGSSAHPELPASGAGKLQNSRMSASSTRSVRVGAASRRESAMRPTNSTTSSSSTSSTGVATSVATAATSQHSPQWSLTSLSYTASVYVDPASHKLSPAHQGVAASLTPQSAPADPPPVSRVPASLEPPSATLTRSKRSSQLVEQALATASADDVMQVDDDAAAVSLEERMSTCTPVPSSSPSPLHAANSPVTWPSATEIFETESPEPESRSSAPSYTLSVFIPTGELDIPGTTVLNDSVVSEPTSARAPAAKRGRGKMLRRNGLSSSTGVESTSSAASITLATLEAAGMISPASDLSSVVQNVSHTQSLAAEDDSMTVNDEDTVVVQSQARAPSPARSDQTARVSRALPSSVTEDHMDVDMDVAEAAVEGDLRLPSPSSDSSGSSSRETSPYEAEAVVVRAAAVKLAPRVLTQPERRELSNLVSRIEGMDIIHLVTSNAAVDSQPTRVAQFTEANGSTQAMQVVAMASQIHVLVGRHVHNATVQELLKKDGHPMHMVFIGSWTNDEALFAYADDDGHLRLFVQCDLMLFFHLRDWHSFFNAREISVDDTMSALQLRALTAPQPLKAVVLRIVITGKDDAWIFRLKTLMWNLPHLQQVIVTSLVECGGWEVVRSTSRLQVSAYQIVHFLENAVQYYGKPLIDIDKERIELLHVDECAEALEKVGHLVR